MKLAIHMHFDKEKAVLSFFYIVEAMKNEKVLILCWNKVSIVHVSLYLATLLIRNQVNTYHRKNTSRIVVPRVLILLSLL